MTSPDGPPRVHDPAVPMKKPQQIQHLDSESTTRQEAPTDPQVPPQPSLPEGARLAGRNGYAWETSTGEGAASALKSLRKMEQKRSNSRPPEDRPGSD